MISNDHSTDDMTREELRGLACILAWWLAGKSIVELSDAHNLDSLMDELEPEDMTELFCLAKRKYMQRGKVWLQQHPDFYDLEAQRAGERRAFFDLDVLYDPPDMSEAPRLQMEYRKVE